MHQPEFYRNNDVWDDDEEERTRGRDPFPMTVDDISDIDDNDVRLGYHVNVIRNRPDTIQGSVNGSLDFLHGGANEFYQSFNVVVLSGAAGDPRIVRQHISHPLQQDPDLIDPSTIKQEVVRYNCLSKQLNTVILPTERVIKMMSEDPAIAPAFNKLKYTLPARELHDWSLLVLMMAAKHPWPEDKTRLLVAGKIFTEDFGFMDPEPLSVRRAALMLIGPRGFVHGWGGSLPYFRREILDRPEVKYVCPAEWGPADTMTDGGDSSYKTDSSGAEGDKADPDFGGPRGIARLRPAVTGMTSDSSESGENTDHLNMFSGGGPTEPKHRKLMKRFVKYVETSNRERRERQAIRRERRLVRKKYESRRRLAEPLFDLEARRAQALAIEKKVNEINYKNQRDARKKDFKRAHRAIHDEASNESDEVIVNSPQAQTRYKQFLARVRAKVIKRWTEDADRRIIELQHELEDNEEEMRFHSWVSPVHWVKQTGLNCGLAVLAMATRPVMTCEVALDSSVDGNENINGTINIDACSKQLKITKLRALTNDIHFLKTCCEITHPPLIVFPPEIMELQNEAVMNNYSSRGEMFSALAMSKLAYSYHVGQYKVHLINRGLWNEYENKQLKKPKKTNVTYEKYFGIKDFDDILSANYNDNDDEQQMNINDVPLSSGINVNLPSMDQEMSNTKGNVAPPSLMQQNEDFEDFNLLNSNGESEKNKFMRDPLKENTDITDDCGVTVSPHNTLWKMSVVKHLMSGNRIAVCYDCDKNMKPSLNNKGSTAHWAIMCGVIVGKAYQKKLYDNQEDGYMYLYEKDTHELKEISSISRNSIIEGTANAGYLFDDPIRRIVTQRRIIKIPYDGNIDVDEANYIKDCGMEYDDYCGDVDSYNNIMHNVDLNNVWVVVQHGKNVGDFDVWKLDQVAKSNQQLKLPNKKILSCFWSSYDDEDTSHTLSQSLCSASLFGTNYKTSFVNVNNSTNVLQNCNNNARPSLNLTLNQNQAGIPPPPPLPPTPSVIMPKKPRPYLPFILPEGVRLENCLAQRFILFKPIRSPYFISNSTNTKLNLCPNQRRGGPQALDPVLCFFTFEASTLT